MREWLQILGMRHVKRCSELILVCIAFIAVLFLTAEAEEIQNKILTAESTNEHWSLFNRFVLALQLLNEADTVGESRHV